MRPSICSPNFNTYNLSLLLSASRIWGSISEVVSTAVGLSGTPLGASETVSGGDRSCEPSMEGEGEGDSEVATKVGTPRLAVLALPNGKVVLGAAIIENAGIGEGEEMEGDMGESVCATSTGCSAKPKFAQPQRLCVALIWSHRTYQLRATWLSGNFGCEL
jgi:hypothetical protein